MHRRRWGLEGTFRGLRQIACLVCCRWRNFSRETVVFFKLLLEGAVPSYIIQTCNEPRAPLAAKRDLFGLVASKSLIFDSCMCYPFRLFGWLLRCGAYGRCLGNSPARLAATGGLSLPSPPLELGIRTRSPSSGCVFRAWRPLIHVLGYSSGPFSSDWPNLDDRFRSEVPCLAGPQSSFIASVLRGVCVILGRDSPIFSPGFLVTLGGGEPTDSLRIGPYPSIRLLGRGESARALLLSSVGLGRFS